MIFFDIDNTLLDFYSAEKIATEKFYDFHIHLFKHIDREKFCEIWSRTAQKYFDEYLKGQSTFNEQRIKRLQEMFSLAHINLTGMQAWDKFLFYQKIYEENYLLFPDTISTLDYLSNKHSLGIISNGELDQQLRKLDSKGIRKYFKSITVSSDAGVAKPNNKIFDIALRKSNLSKENCWYIGDKYETDIKPCEDFGMKAILVDRLDKEIYGEKTLKTRNLAEIISVIENYNKD